MFPFWEKVVAPVLEAAQVRRIVEVGALRGENTRLMLDRLGPEVELHVIDPVPDFDPEEHARQFGGQYVFHRALSVDVLGDLPPMDGALIDGDHNWYTVINEMRLLSRVARAAGRPLPVMILHDVGWPYGRRDLYYAPDTIPDEFRQPWRNAGMRPGRSELIEGAGLNPTMCNADHEGGPRNGVMTAVDDFIAEYDKPLRLVFLPIYFGLAIVVEEERLAAQPALASELDRIESSGGKDELLSLSEDIRLEAMIFQHRLFFDKERDLDHRADLYLDSVKRALANEHYLENESRMARLVRHIRDGKELSPLSLRDPLRMADVDIRRRMHLRATGQAGPGEVLESCYAFSPWGRVGLDGLEKVLDDLRTDHIRGDLAVCGVDRGGAAIFVRAYVEVHGLRGRFLWVADRFRAAPDGRNGPSAEEDGLLDFLPDLNLIREGFERFGLFDGRTKFLQGDLDTTLTDAPMGHLALIHIGRNLGDQVGTVLAQLYPRLNAGGYVVVDDASDPATAEAVSAFRAEHGVSEPEIRLGAVGTQWRKTTEPTFEPGVGDAVGEAPAARRAGASFAPLARPVTGHAPGLSVVVVFHNMHREAARTLRSLSRPYQMQVDDLDYEVIVVENGSDPGQHLGEAFVSRFGPEFRYIDMGADAPSSPVPALNRGIRESRGNSLALMIDGAHVLSPGVLRQGMTGLVAYRPSIVLTQPWHLGPSQQSEAMQAGYDQAAEDELLERIGWPEDGYKLFDIAHLQGGRDSLDGLWESNCLFVPRWLLEQVGGFDEGFDQAGGGFTNLEIYERLGATPGVSIVSILGEGSFHQFHGGTTTNKDDPAARWEQVASSAERFAELRGRSLTGPEKPVHFVGAFRSEGARRTRARRMSAAEFDTDPSLEGIDGPLTKPVMVPDDLRDRFVTAYYQSHAWRTTKWLGEDVHNAPTDLLTYQEIVTEVRPDWIIETGTRTGGRALFLASVCELLGHGRVVSIAPTQGDDLPQHDRITYVEGKAHDRSTVAKVKKIVGKDPEGLLIMGTRGGRQRMNSEFKAYSRFVGVGSYAVMENTVLNGYPVDATFGYGPFEAVRNILNQKGEFVADTRRDRHTLSLNIGGFLKRVK